MAAQGNDCRFYYNSTCDKGSRCPFRHSEPARFSSTTCNFWKSGRCTKTNCSYRHSVITKDQKSLCFYENQPGGCTRPNCSYIHERPRHRLQYHEDMSDTHAMGPCLDSRSSSRSSSCSPSPSTPTMVNCTSNSIMLAWEEPEEEWEDTCIESYKIGYREYNKNHSKWAFVDTKNTQTLFTVDDLKGETEYEFKVCTVDDEGNDGPFSFPPIVMSTRPSLARSVKRESIKIKNGNPEIYKIPLEKSRNATNKFAKTKKCFFGKKKIGATGKTIMLVGATGSGKSTLVDGIINYITGVSWDDDFRFSMVDLSDDEKKRQRDQTQSQTEWITCYTIRTMSGSRLDYDLHIVDTPGFGDTRGIGKDQAIIDQIREFFTTRGNQGITYLDAVCFVTQAPLARLTPTQRYLFDAILSIFGQDIANNIYILITFADGNDPPVIEALQAANVPYRKCYKFNNSALFTSAKNTDESNFGSLFWKMGQSSFRIFFDELQFVETKSFQLTKEVLQLRKNIETTIEGLQPQIHEGMNTLNTIRQEKDILRKHEEDIEANRNFTYEVDEIHMMQIDLPVATYVTNCLICNRTCHFPCLIPEDRQKMNCSAMRDKYCTVCPKKCRWDVHKNNDFRFETYSVKVRKSYEELKQKYQTAQIQKQRQRSVLDQVKQTFNNLYQNVIKMLREVRCYINKLNEIALRQNPLSDVDYIDLLIENEKNEKKYGWKERLKFYNKMREEAELIAKAKTLNIKPWGECEDAIKDDY